MGRSSRVWSSPSSPLERKYDGEEERRGQLDKTHSSAKKLSECPSDVKQSRAFVDPHAGDANTTTVTASSAASAAADGDDGDYHVLTPIDARQQRPGHTDGFARSNGITRKRSLSSGSVESSVPQKTEPWQRERTNGGRRVSPSRLSGERRSPSAGASEDTLRAAASLVSFHKPRSKDAPRLKGPLGSNALRVTLGTPVEHIGTCSIGRSVEAKLSLPRTAPTPDAPARPSSSADGTDDKHGGCVSGPLAPDAGSAAQVPGSKSGAGGRRSTSAGMFDAVSPAATADPATPYSVCRVGRDEKLKGKAKIAPECGTQQPAGRGHSSPCEHHHQEQQQPRDETETAAGGDPLCHTPRKPASPSAGAEHGDDSKRGDRWSELCATPPPRAMPMSTPCSGSKFRSCKEDEESDYDDYDEVTRVLFVRNGFATVLESTSQRNIFVCLLVAVTLISPYFCGACVELGDSVVWSAHHQPLGSIHLMRPARMRKRIYPCRDSRSPTKSALMYIVNPYFVRNGM